VIQLLHTGDTKENYERNTDFHSFISIRSCRQAEKGPSKEIKNSFCQFAPDLFPSLHNYQKKTESIPSFPH
jgi:hypothetical protein